MISVVSSDSVTIGTNQVTFTYFFKEPLFIKVGLTYQRANVPHFEIFIAVIKVHNTGWKFFPAVYARLVF